tara:strand:- start:4353 stop:4643 length:291 start_codon:yes stop_codon:yes gene_type:complete
MVVVQLKMKRVAVFTLLKPAWMHFATSRACRVQRFPAGATFEQIPLRAATGHFHYVGKWHSTSPFAFPPHILTVCGKIVTVHDKTAVKAETIEKVA